MINPFVLRYLPHIIAVIAIAGAAWWAYSAVWDKGYAQCEAENAAVVAQATARAHQNYLDAVAKGDAISSKLALEQAKVRRLKDELANSIDRLRGQCPTGLRVIHDAAATGQPVPETTGVSLDTPTAVDARALAQAIAGNYTDCRNYIAQLNALIDWHEEVRP